MATQKNSTNNADEEHDLDNIDLAESVDGTPPHIKTGRELEEYIEDIAESVRIGLDQSIAILTPWFFNNMPTLYYQTTPRAEKVRHLSAVITGHVFETKQTVELWDRDRTKVTFIGPGSDSKILIDMTRKLANLNLKMGSLYFSRDKLLFLSTFFSNHFKQADSENKLIAGKSQEAKRVLLEEFPDDEEGIDHYLNNLDHDYVVYATSKRLHITYRMVKYMQDHEGAHTFIEPIPNSSKGRLTLGIKGVQISEIAEQVFHLIHRYGFDINRAFLVRFEEEYEDPINVMHFEIKDQSEKVDYDNLDAVKLSKALRTLGWVDSDEYAILCQEPTNFSINAANLIRSIASWTHVQLGKDNPYYYSEYKIQQTFFKHTEITTKLVTLFRIRFDPLWTTERESECSLSDCEQSLKLHIEEIIDQVERYILRAAYNFINHILATNYFLSGKTGLAFRLSPDVLDKRYYPNKPYGIYFITGRDYRFFQVRWKDIARGGLRVVMPRNIGDYGYAQSGLFDEVYGLSHAQQLKNKDIPEGGSKAVLLLAPGGSKTRAVKGAINALLDLLVSKEESETESSGNIIRYYDQEEIIYLGPDENMTNDLIEWVPEQARRRGYKYAKAFMSSKPGDGINHKEYGVTSEGLHVFLDHTLKFLQINPRKESFSIKITGGPDGDVAGNELKILNREYGENARVVAIADGLGAAYDPKGLEWKELLRLVDEGLSICHFNRSLLSKDESAFIINADTNENIRKRNELHAKAVADIFVPAGGRPYTVNEKNSEKFMTMAGEPSCRAIVEGANIFFTKEAREHLQKKGIFMIKDSSANKTGVICSSYEIMASLILTSPEFHAFKEEYVTQVITILRAKAAAEAQLLFREYLNLGGKKPLVELSMDVSKEINEVTDLLLEHFSADQDKNLDNPIFQRIIKNHCPQILIDKYENRILKDLPKAHQIAILAASIASDIIYSEGLGWLHQIPEENRFNAAITYINQKQATTDLIEQVNASEIKEKKKIAAILQKSAARELTMLELTNHD